MIVFMLILWVIFRDELDIFQEPESGNPKGNGSITLVPAEDNGRICIGKIFEFSTSGNDWASSSGNAVVFAGRNAGISVDESDVVFAGGKNCVSAVGHAGLN